MSPEILTLGTNETLRQYLARVQKCVIEATREQYGGSMWKAAKRLGMTRSNLDYLLRTARALVS